jgi:hypothetical protein
MRNALRIRNGQLLGVQKEPERYVRKWLTSSNIIVLATMCPVRIRRKLGSNFFFSGRLDAVLL